MSDSDHVERNTRYLEREKRQKVKSSSQLFLQGGKVLGSVFWGGGVCCVLRCHGGTCVWQGG